ncbi:MazG-like family protein [Terribacillus saccharophilus]|uniref:MazG-like family protein n=1 Tax=Terribacillus saccharophilus TaxID=361277 RepID=UPI002DCAFEA7|nr:MazG-like family protein [Terribacillus saccharophilus]
MDNYLERLKKLSDLEPKTLEQMALKLSEEAGEVSQAVLSYSDASGSSYKQLDKEDIKEECVDTVLVALSLFYKLSDREGELQELLDKKMTKWESNIS